MRIAILSHGTMPFGLQMAQECCRQGHETMFWSLSTLDRSECVGFGGIELVPKWLEKWRKVRWAYYLSSAIPLRREVRRWKPDVVLAIYMTSAGVLTGLISEAPVVLSAIGSDINEHVDSVMWRLAFRYLSRRAVGVHSVGDDISKKLSRIIGIPAEKIVTAPVGIDTRSLQFIPQASRPKNAVVISTRRHELIYDHETLLRAMKEIQELGYPVELKMIASKGFEATRRRARALGLKQVTFIERFENRDLPRVLEEANIYVSCSVADGTSQSLLEAMSVGLFPVVSDIAANAPWIVHGINGYVFPVGDHAALSKQIVEAHKNSVLRQEACARNRLIAESRADIRICVREILQHIELRLSTHGT